MNKLANYPSIRLIITLVLTVAIGVFSSIFATQITPKGVLTWSLAFHVSSFWFLSSSLLILIFINIAYLKYDQNVLRFSENQHCIAHIRKTKLEGLAALVKKDPEKAQLINAKEILKNLEVSRDK